MTTTRTTTHARVRTTAPNGTWDEHRQKWKEWGSIIGTAHAYHDLFHEIGDMSVEALNHIVHAHIGGTLAWEADMPNPIEAWHETYDEEMPDDVIHQWEVRAWARTYYKAYEDEVYRLAYRAIGEHYRENPIEWVRGH